MITTAAIIIAGVLIFVFRILFGDAFGKEEAQHGLYGLWIWRDLVALDFRAFLYDTQRQMLWPFLHSWLTAIFFFTFGPNIIAARLLSLFLFMITLVLMYLLMAHYAHDYGEKPGILAVGLALTSPLMVSYASQSMLESLGAFLFLAAAYTYMLCEEKKITLEYVLLALLIGLSIYTNYLFAFLMVVAFMVVTLVKLGPILVNAVKLSQKGERSAMHFIWWAYRKLIVLFVLLILIAGWFSFNFSRKIIILTSALFKYNSGEQVFGFLPNLFYYPKVIITQASFSPWLGLLLLISLFLPFVATKFEGLNRLFIFVWTVLVLLTVIVPAKASQMLYIILPFIFIIFASVFYSFKEKVSLRDQKIKVWVLALAFIPALVSFPTLVDSYFPFFHTENMQTVMNYFKTTLPDDKVAVMALNLQHLNPEVLEFSMRDSKQQIITDLALAGPTGGADNKYLLTLVLDENSKYNADVLDDSLFRWNAYITDKQQAGKVKLYSTRRFSSIGVSAFIYEEI